MRKMPAFGFSAAGMASLLMSDNVSADGCRKGPDCATPPIGG